MVNITALSPRPGMVAWVRNRRGVISLVMPFDGPQGRQHQVDIDYNDGDTPQPESLLMKAEPGWHLFYDMNAVILCYYSLKDN